MANPAAPIVLLLGSTFPVSGPQGIQPLALQSLHNKSLIDHWCARGDLGAVGSRCARSWRRWLRRPAAHQYALRSTAPPVPARWASLHGAGFASPERVFVVTNAVFYKAFEFWALGKGLDVSHVINTGRTLGDAR